MSEEEQGEGRWSNGDGDDDDNDDGGKWQDGAGVVYSQLTDGRKEEGKAAGVSQQGLPDKARVRRMGRSVAS
ncbi:hypothetical protein PYCC9005_005617 [Savitreella phatthalungensis]